MVSSSWGSVYTSLAYTLIFIPIWGTASSREARGAGQRVPIAGPYGLHPGYDPPCHNSSNLNSFLWTIRRDPLPPAYFFGSIHVPFTKVWNFIPSNMKQAFQRADQVFFELDLTDPSTISSLASCQLLPEGQKLANVIPHDLFRRLKRHLKKVKNHMPQWMTADQKNRGLYADYLFNAITGNWEHKRPVWVMLMVNSLTENSVKTKGIPVLDLYLAQEAKRMKKGTGAVERVEEHCIPLNELNFSQALFTLNQTLWHQEQHYRGMAAVPARAPRYTTADLINHYNCGDLDTIIYSTDSATVPNIVQSESLPPAQLAIAQGINQYFHDELIYKRNQRMADRVVDLLQTHPNDSFFFAFGAGHFLGNNTVIDKLREEGFQVEFTPADASPYLGEDYDPSEDRESLLAYISPEAVIPAEHGGPPYLQHPFSHRHRHRQSQRQREHRKKKRKEDRERQRQKKKRLENNSTSILSPTDSDGLKRSNFNDLWVRLEATSFWPRLTLASTSVTPASKDVITYSSSSCPLSHHNNQTLLITILLMLNSCVCSLVSW